MKATKNLYKTLSSLKREFFNNIKLIKISKDTFEDVSEVDFKRVCSNLNYFDSIKKMSINSESDFKCNTIIDFFYLLPSRKLKWPGLADLGEREYLGTYNFNVYLDHNVALIPETLNGTTENNFVKEEESTRKSFTPPKNKIKKFNFMKKKRDKKSKKKSKKKFFNISKSNKKI